jgi:hypothetical protein
MKFSTGTTFRTFWPLSPTVETCVKTEILVLGNHLEKYTSAYPGAGDQDFCLFVLHDDAILPTFIYLD